MKTQIKAFYAATVAALLTASLAAHAELPAVVGTSLTAIKTDATDIFGLVFPVVAAVLGLVIVIKLFKRFTNKV